MGQKYKKNNDKWDKNNDKWDKAKSLKTIPVKAFRGFDAGGLYLGYILEI